MTKCFNENKNLEEEEENCNNQKSRYNRKKALNSMKNSQLTVTRHTNTKQKIWNSSREKKWNQTNQMNFFFEEKEPSGK